MLMTLVYKYTLELMEASIKLSYQICKAAKDKDNIKGNEKLCISRVSN